MALTVDLKEALFSGLQFEGSYSVHARPIPRRRRPIQSVRGAAGNLECLTGFIPGDSIMENVILRSTSNVFLATYLYDTPDWRGKRFLTGKQCPFVDPRASAVGKMAGGRSSAKRSFSSRRTTPAPIQPETNQVNTAYFSRPGPSSKGVSA